MGPRRTLRVIPAPRPTSTLVPVREDVLRALIDASHWAVNTRMWMEGDDHYMPPEVGKWIDAKCDAEHHIAVAKFYEDER